MTTEVTVRDAPADSRLEAVLPDGRVAGYAHYRAGQPAYVFDHTVVDDELEGQGVGGQLARGVVGWARERGLAVDPTCSFLRAHLARHPEDHDVLADGVDLG
jgi:predicted GNAT family acetyltransferase